MGSTAVVLTWLTCLCREFSAKEIDRLTDEDLGYKLERDHAAKPWPCFLFELRSTPTACVITSQRNAGQWQLSEAKSRKNVQSSSTKTAYGDVILYVAYGQAEIEHKGC